MVHVFVALKFVVRFLLHLHEEIEVIKTIAKAPAAFKHIARVIHSQVREHAKAGNGVTHKLAQVVTGERPRSDKWPAVEHAFRRSHPTCAACNGAERLQVHHMQPFHIHPELELDPTNLIALCMGKFECHLKIGHGDNFKAWNPNVKSDAEIVLKNPGLRAEYEAKAENARCEGAA